MIDFSTPVAAQALDVVHRLQERGFVAYFAGGCVRDALLGRVPKDVDVATDATPDAVRELFGRRRTLAFGASFGVIGVMGPALTPTEVATFRSDGEYSDGRRPDSVHFGSAEQDALRRDFTINGMFFDPIKKQVIDFVGGQRDLENQIIRAIGNPEFRFSEDKLRVLRAVRFAAVLAFAIEGETANAMARFAADVSIVSGERIGAELRRMLGGPGTATALKLLEKTELLKWIWPTLASRCTDNHSFRSDIHRLATASSQEAFVPTVAAIALRISQETSLPISGFLGEISDRWKLSCEEQRGIEQGAKYLQTVLRADELPWSVVQPVLASRDGQKVVAAARIWVSAFNASASGLQLCEDRLGWPSERLAPMTLVTGDTLRDLGHVPGPAFRDVLAEVRRQQLDGRISTPDQAISLAKELLSIDGAP